MTAVQQWWFTGTNGRTRLGRVVFREDFERADPAADYPRTAGAFSSADFEITDSPYGDKAVYFNTQLLTSGYTQYVRDLGQDYTFDTIEVKFMVSSLGAPDDAAVIQFYEDGVERMWFNPLREGNYDGERRSWFSFDGQVQPVSADTPEANVWYRMTLYIRPGGGQSTVEITRLDTNTVIHTQALMLNLEPVTFNRLAFYIDSGGYTTPTHFDDIVCYNR